MNYIPRAVQRYVERAVKTFKCVLLTGARQTGKSTMLKRLFPAYRYVPLDDPFVEDQARENPDMFFMLNPPSVFLDEVQRAPSLFRYLKMKCDESDQRGRFLLYGSQPLELMESASESLSGRVCVVELSGLSLREISGDPFNEPFVPTLDYIARRNQTAKAPENIWEIIHRGGYPELQNREVEWSAFFSSYVKTYLERDVRKLSAVQDLDDFRRFMVAVAARTGQMLNYSNIADEISKDANTVKRWLSLLEATGIVYLLEPYTPSVLKRAIKTPKVYFRDTGLASYLTRWLTPETLANGAMSGAMFETFVISEILKSYSNQGIDYRYCVSYYRGKDKKRTRADGVEDGILHPIEIKKSAKVTADQTSAFTVLDQVPDKKRGDGALICLCPQPGKLRENVFQIPVWFI